MRPSWKSTPSRPPRAVWSTQARRRTARSTRSRRTASPRRSSIPEDKHIWTLLPAPDGTLYAGTGEKGRIYKIAADGTGKVFYESGTTHITALAWDGKGALLVGTSSPGRVVRVDPTTGRGFVLLESAYKEVRSIKVSSAGTIFATAVGAGSDASSAPTEKPSSTIDTSSTPIASVSTEVTITAIGDQTIVTPSSGGSSRSESRSGTAKGAVYRIAPDGEWDEFWTSNDDAPYDVLIEPNGSLPSRPATRARSSASPAIRRYRRS